MTQTLTVNPGDRVTVLPDHAEPLSLTGPGTVRDTWPLAVSGAPTRGLVVDLDDGDTVVVPLTLVAL